MVLPASSGGGKKKAPAKKSSGLDWLLSNGVAGKKATAAAKKGITAARKAEASKPSQMGLPTPKHSTAANPGGASLTQNARRTTNVSTPSTKKSKKSSFSSGGSGSFSSNGFTPSQLDAIAKDHQISGGEPKSSTFTVSDPGFSVDPNVAKLIAAIGSPGGAKSVNFKGDLKSYVDKYKSMMPTVGYDKLIANAQDQAATGDKKIQGFTSGLQAYIGGLGGSLKQQAQDSADLRTQGATAATDLLNAAYDASRKSVSDQLAAIGGMSQANPDPGGTSQAHQQAAAGDIAKQLQISLNANASDLASRQAFNDTAGASAGMQGQEQRSQLQRDLAKMVAQYQTQQSQENASNAMQALSMGTGQYNADRSYAQSEAQRAQDAANQAYAARVNAANMAISQDNTRYDRYLSQQNTANASATAAAKAAQDQANWEATFNQKADQFNATQAAKAKTGPSAAQTSLYGTLVQQSGGDANKLAALLAAAKKAGIL